MFRDVCRGIASRVEDEGALYFIYRQVHIWGIDFMTKITWPLN